MRYVHPAATTGVVLALFILAGQSVSASPSITNYQLVSEQRVTRTEWYYTYRADLVNPGAGRASMTASVTSRVLGGKVVPGQGMLHFAPVPANGTVRSSDTFTIMVDRNQAFSLTDLQWAFLSPTANAGPNQTVAVGNKVFLNGSGSADPGLAGPLSYFWTIKSRPASSSATLLNPANVMPSFVADAPGRYTVELTVSNGAGSDSAQVLISTLNSPPVANAGAGQTVTVGAKVTLNGSNSSDVDGDPLTYQWTLISLPNGSAATLQNGQAVVSSFNADKAGAYVAQLVVNDGTAASTPSTVTITTQNVAPVANAGPNQVSMTGSIIQLNGAGSTDVDGDSLTYSWSLITKPAASTAALNNAKIVNPTFVADAAGIYVAQLIVNDGKVDSTPATTTITTSIVQAPAANAGPSQTVIHGTMVNLAGSGTDPQGKPLTYLWSLITRPPGSTAALSNDSISNPVFLADQPGTYVAQLIVSNGTLSSAPSSLTVTTTNTPPVAVAGPGQISVVGSTVTLDGSASTDADSDPLTFAWSLMSRPAASAAVVVSPLSKTPTLNVDAAGTYVVQLIVNDGFVNSSPVTTTITVNTMAISLTPNPLNLSNSPKLMRIALGAQAGPGGQEVKLQGFDPSVISVTDKVVVPEGGTSVDVTVTPIAGGSTMILATSVGYQPGSVTVNVTTPAILVSLSAGVVGLSRTVNGTVTLSSPAPPTGTTVAITATPAGVVALDTSSVNIGPGNTTGTFAVTGVTEGAVVVRGSSAGYISGSANLQSALLGAITMPAEASLTPGQTTGLDVKLAMPAPLGGVLIQLVSSDITKVTVDPQVFIAHGNLSPVTPPQVNAIAFGSAIITASAPGLTGANQTVKVGGALSFSSPAITVGAGGTQNVTLLLTAPAPTVGLSVLLSSSNPQAATAPPQVVIPSGQTSVTFAVTGIAAGSAILTANSGIPFITNATATVSVVVFGAITLPANVSVGLGGNAPVPVTLSGTAPAGGLTVQLSSSDSAKVSLLSPSVFIEAGKTQPLVQPQVKGENLGQVTLTATAAGYGSTSTVVKSTASLGFVESSTTVIGIETKSVTLTLSGPAPSGGLTVNLAASPGGVVTVPANVLIAQGTTTKTVAVTGIAPGTATITASSAAPNVTSATTSVTVLSAGLLALQSGVTVSPGLSQEFDITLPAPAPADVTVNLSSADPAKVTVSPSSVTILAGQTHPTPKPKATGVAFGSATINASAAGYGATSQLFTVGATMSLAPQALTISGTATQNLTLSLSVPAPSGGLLATLSASQSGIVTIPPSVTILAGASTVSVPVTGITLGTVTITATTTAPNVPKATAVVTVQSAGALVLPAGVTVAPGATVPFMVTLPVPALSNLTVTLTSSDETKVKVSPATLTIPAGQTQVAGQPAVQGVGFGAATITASAPGYGSTSQSVKVGATLAFTPQPLLISGTATQDLTLTLSAPAPAGGLAVNLTVTPAGVVTIPASVTILAGAATVKVPVTGAALGSATITAAAATAPNVPNATAAVTVQSAGGLTLPAGVTVAPGASVPFVVTLPVAAPSAVTVTFTSSDETKVKVSVATLIIPAGQTQVAGQPGVQGIAFGEATVTASAQGYTSTTQSVKVGATFAFTPQPLLINGITTQDLTLTLSAPAPAGGLAVNLTVAPAGIVTIPASVTILAGAATVKVPVTGAALGSATITAAAATAPNVPNATASVTVQSAGAITLPAGVTVAPGGSAPFVLTLPAAAPSAVTVTLTSSDETKVKVSVATLTIPAGQTQVAGQPSVQGIGFGEATITASAPGYTSATQIVKVGATLAFTPQPLLISGAATQDLTLTLSAPAPAGGLAVNLTVSPAGIVTIPGSVNIAAGAATVKVPVTGVALGSATITAASATAPNVPNATANVTVQNVGTVTLPQSITVPLGQTTALALSLPVAPASDTVVSLSSSDTAKLTVLPATVTILAGQTQPASQPQLTGKGLGTATINATAPFYAPASRSVQITGSISFSPQNLTITGTETQNLTLTLSAPAPTGGFAINVSSSNTAVATVTPATVTIPGNLTTVTVPVKGVAQGSAVVTASAPGFTNATAAITVKPPIDIIVPATFTVAPGQQLVFPISLANTQPSMIWVALSSSDPTIAAPSLSSFTIPANSVLPQSPSQIKIIGYKPGNVTITATAIGLAPAASAVKVQYTISLSPASLNFTGLGVQKTLTVTLSAPAPAEGLLVSLNSSNTSVATLRNQSITIPGNSTSAGFPVTSVGPGSAVIRANAAGIPEATSDVTVSGQGTITIAATSSLTLGQTVPLTVTLNAPAPAGGLTVNLTSTDSAKVSVLPPSIVIPEGASTTSAVAIKANNVGAATISATALNYAASNDLPVTVGATLVWITPTLTISGIGKVGMLTLELPVPLAFESRVTVALSSSNPSVATVQPSINIISDGSTQGRVVIQITSVAAGTTQIRASGINIPEVSATVTVVGPPVVTTAALPDGSVGVEYGGAMAATGGLSPLTWSAAGLPGNVQLNAAGQFSGKPTAMGSFPVVVTVKDASNPQLSGTKNLILKVLAAPPAAAIAVVDGSGQFAQINTAFSKVLKVLVSDANNNPVSGATVNFAAPASGAGGAFTGGNSAVTDASGVAVSPVFTANATAGAYLVTASAAGGSPSTTFSLTNTAGPAATIAVHAGSSQNTVVNTAFANRMQAIVKDVGGNPVSGVVVTFLQPATGASGAFTGAATATTVASGIATANVFTANAIAGVYSVSASAPGVATPAAFDMTNKAGAAASVTATDGTSQNAAINTAFAKVLKVVVKDAGNNLVSGVTVTFTPPASGASGAFAGGNTAVSDASGVAVSSVFTANGTVGSYSVTASAAGAPTTASFNLTNVAGPPSTVTIVEGTPQNATIGTAYGLPLKVLVKDALNNAISGVVVTFAVPSSGASGTFAGPNTVQTDANGHAASPVITANTVAGTFAVTATATGATPATFMLTNKIGPAASIALSAGSGQTASINTAFTLRLKALVKDAGQNPVVGAIVTFSAPASGASGTFAGGVNTATTDAGGIATSELFTANGTAGGPYAVTATVPPAVGSVSFMLTNTAGVPASIVAFDGSIQTASINTAFTKQLKAQVKDAGGNGVVGALVTFTKPASGASGAFAGGVNTATTDASGFATSPVFTANGTVGTYAVTATVGQVVTPASFTLTNAAGPPASITYLSGAPQTAAVNAQFTNPMRVTVKDAAGNNVIGATVTFTPPASGASGAFVGAATALTDGSGVATSNAFKANTITGSYSVTASIGNLTPVTFAMTNVPGTPAQIVNVGGAPQSAPVSTAFALPLQAQVKDAFNNLVVGASVTFSVPGVGASGSFAAGKVAYTTNAQGIAITNTFTANSVAGSYNVTATVAAVSTTFAMTNNPASGSGIITLNSPTVGQDLQAPITIHFSPPAAPGTTLTLTSSNAARALLGSAAVLGTGTVATSLTETTSDMSTYVKALVGTGTVTLTVSATGYANATATVTFAPSGFVVAGSQGIGGNFTTYKGMKTMLTVYAARLNGTSFVENQEVRGGITVAVPVASTPTTVGIVSPASVSIPGGSATGTTQFTASSINTGNATITVTAPAGFTPPSTGATLTANVLQSGILPFTAAIGKNLQVPVYVSLTGITTSDVEMRVLSNDSSKLRFSTEPGTAGLAEITMTIPVNQDNSPVFYAQAFTNTGSVGYTVDVTGLGTATGTVSMAPSGFVINSFTGMGQDFSVVAGSGNPGFEVVPARLTAIGGTYVEQQALAGGLTANVGVTVANGAIGLVNPATVVITGGSFAGNSQFEPTGVAGSTAITANPPAGYTAATFGTVNVTVQSAVMIVPENPVTIGKNLQVPSWLALTVPSPNQLQVTITSSNESLLKFAASPTSAGARVLVLTIPAGQTRANFYLQGVGDAGVATYTVSAPGFSTKNRSATLAPSGVVVDAYSPQFLVSGPFAVTVYTALLDPTSHMPVEFQNLAGGHAPLQVDLSSSNPALGSIQTPATILAGQQTVDTVFTPVAKGSTTISVVGVPLGGPVPASMASVNVTVQ